MATTDPTTLYSTLATASATLIGLLFVAISLVLDGPKTEQKRIGIEVQASGCMLCFIDVLVITLLGLSESSNVGPSAVIIGIIGFIYGLASLRSLWVIKKHWRTNYSRLGFIVTFMVLFVIQFFTGLDIVSRHLKSMAALNDFSTLPIIILLVGVARTWQLIGLRDTGIISSLKTIIRGDKESNQD